MSEAALAVTCARDHGRQLAMNAGDRLLAQLNQLERALDEAASSRHDYFDEEREGQPARNPHMALALVRRTLRAQLQMSEACRLSWTGLAG